MTEPKRRGRPPKAKPCHDCGQAVGHYDDCPVGITGPTHNGDTSREPEDLIELPVVETSAEVALLQAEMRRGVEIAALGSSDINPAQVYADRVWSGQSVSAERSWRIQRVKDALAGQGLPFDGVVLP
jgi:hypothetical protein